MMSAKQSKIAIKFKLTRAEAGTLIALGFDTPRKIKDAGPDDLPEAILQKLSRFHGKK